MENAYDVAALIKKLEMHGLTIAEEAARTLVIDVLDWVEASAKISPTPWDDVALVVLPEFKKKILAEIDKIDGVGV